MNKCLYDPSTLTDIPLGMFHCPECGEMVIAGIPHPDYSILYDDPPKGSILSDFINSIRGRLIQIYYNVRSFL